MRSRFPSSLWVRPNLRSRRSRRSLEGPDRVALVVTQPDRPRGTGDGGGQEPRQGGGRGARHSRRNARKGLGPRFHPARHRYLPRSVSSLSPTARYSGDPLLDIPRMGVVNVHASLLPAYRGAAPINRAIIDGRVVTGVTTMLLDEGVDTGDILLSREIPIGPEETAGELADRLALSRRRLLTETIEALKEGRIGPSRRTTGRPPTPRCSRKRTASSTGQRRPRPSKNHIRGMTPWPGAFTRLGDRMIKVFGIRQDSEKSDAPPGTIVRVAGDGIYVAAGGRVVVITDLQAPGKQRMEAGQFVRGNKIPVGSRFGAS